MSLKLKLEHLTERQYHALLSGQRIEILVDIEAKKNGVGIVEDLPTIEVEVFPRG